MYENIANLPYIKAKLDMVDNDIEWLKTEEIERFKYIIQNPKNKNNQELCIEAFKGRRTLIAQSIIRRKNKILESMIKEFKEMLDKSSQEKADSIIEEGVEICKNAKLIDDAQTLMEVEEIRKEVISSKSWSENYQYPSLWILALQSSNDSKKKFKCIYLGATMYGCKNCREMLALEYLYGSKEVEQDVNKALSIYIDLAFKDNHQPAINQLGRIQNIDSDYQEWEPFMTANHKKKLGLIVPVDPKNLHPYTSEYKIQKIQKYKKYRKKRFFCIIQKIQKCTKKNLYFV